MTLRVLNFFMAALFALLSLFWVGASVDGLRFENAIFEKGASGEYQNFWQTDSGFIADNPLNALEKFVHSPETAPGYANASKGGVLDLIKGLEPLPNTGGRTTQYPKTGGYNQANADFDLLKLNNVREINMPNGGTGRVGELPDGTKVVVRSRSSENRPGFTSQPTLEIQYVDGPVKIRY